MVSGRRSVIGSLGDAVMVSATFVPAVTLSLFNCEVSSSAGHGIVVDHSPTTPTRVEVSGCNLFGNGGAAIVNRSNTAIRARGNWWGDASGPLGPNGDGIEGTIDATGPLAAPVRP